MRLPSSSHYFQNGVPLAVAEARHSGDMEPHFHDFWEMVYVRSGRGEHWIEDRAYPIQAGDLYVISPGECHRYAPLPGETVRIVNVLWTPELVGDVLRETGTENAETLKYVAPLLRDDLRFEHRLHLEARLAFRVEVLLDEMRRELLGEATGRFLLVRHLFCALMVLLSRAAKEKQGGIEEQEESLLSGRQIVERAVQYLEDNAAAALHVEDVARSVGLSASRLAHLFKEHTGRSVIYYLHEIRVARACAALVSGSKKIDAIGAACGFNDGRFFHRVFQRHTGTTPAAYRQRFRPG